MRREVYLDNNATTPVAPEVVEAMAPYWREHFGNPSSAHRKGVEAERAVRRSRATIARLLGVNESEVIFTSGGTEGDNLAIKGVARALRRRGMHILTTKIEHPAVLESCRDLEAEGFRVTYLDVDAEGMVTPEAVEAALTPETILVSIMHVNNELGTILPISEIAERHGRSVTVQGLGPMFHVAFTRRPRIRDARDYRDVDAALYAAFASRLQERGIRVIPRGIWYLSTAHTEEDIARTLESVAAVL